MLLRFDISSTGLRSTSVRSSKILCLMLQETFLARTIRRCGDDSHKVLGASLRLVLGFRAAFEGEDIDESFDRNGGLHITSRITNPIVYN